MFAWMNHSVESLLTCTRLMYLRGLGVGIVGFRLRLARYILSIRLLGKMGSPMLEYAALHEGQMPRVLTSEYSGNDAMASKCHR